MEIGKTKQQTNKKTKQEYFKVGEGTCHLAWQLEFDFQNPPGKRTNSIKLSSDLYTGMSAYI